VLSKTEVKKDEEEPGMKTHGNHHGQDMNPQTLPMTMESWNHRDARTHAPTPWESHPLPSHNAMYQAHGIQSVQALQKALPDPALLRRLPDSSLLTILWRFGLERQLHWVLMKIQKCTLRRILMRGLHEMPSSIH